MNEIELNDIEVASPSVVRSAARDFASALAETSQFQAFEQAYMILNQDAAARQALSAYQAKAGSLRAMLMRNSSGWLGGRSSRNTLTIEFTGQT